MINTIVTCLAVVLIGQSSSLDTSESASSTSILSKQSAASLVGNWRVTGQPKRGSTAGAYAVSSRIAWQKVLQEEDEKVAPKADAELWLLMPDSPVWKAVGIKFDAKENRVGGLIIVKFPEQKPQSLIPEKNSRVDRPSFVTKSSGTGEPEERWTFQRRTPDRWLILVESRKSPASGWSRLIELGLTREGTTIALGDGQPKCVVTGGLGEIEVTVNGKTVFVCCSGCRDALLEDPDAFLKPVAKVPGSPQSP